MPKLSLRAQGTNQVLVTRHFSAVPAAIYRAHIDPELIAQWMLGPDGWRLSTCASDARPGGKIHFVWQNDAGESFSLTGAYKSLEPNKRIIHVERMHLPYPTPDNTVDTRFNPDGSGTLLAMTMTLPDGATRKAMLETGMADGMEISYGRLDMLKIPG